MINNKFPLMNGGGNYEIEYINKGYAKIQKSRNDCNGTCMNCKGGCGWGSGCVSACWGGCSGCEGSCSGCSGCSGCGSCGSGCSGCSGCGGCDSGCSTTCKNTCQGLCTGNGAMISINGVNKTSKFYTGISSTVKQSSTQYFSINGVNKTPV